MNVACGNVDDHNKNFSFMMGKDGVWHAAPAYDFTFAVDPDAPDYVNVHSMTINGKNEDIGREDLLSIAKRFNIKNPSAIIDKALTAAKAYPQYAAAAYLPPEWLHKIEAEIHQRLSNIGQ